MEVSILQVILRQCWNTQYRNAAAETGLRTGSKNLQTTAFVQDVFIGLLTFFQKVLRKIQLEKDCRHNIFAVYCDLDMIAGFSQPSRPLCTSPRETGRFIKR